MCSPSLFKLLHLQSNKTHQQQKTHDKLRETITNKHHQTHKYIISQLEPERYLFAVGSRAGYPVFLLFVCFLEAFLFLFFFVVVFMFFLLLTIEGNPFL